MFSSKLLSALGRYLIALFFISSGLTVVFDWAHAHDFFISTLRDWTLYLSGYSWAEDFFERLIDYSFFFLLATTLFQLLGALLLVLGWRVRFASLLLIFSLIPLAALYHDFWFLAGEERELKLSFFLRDLAIIGGLLTLFVLGKPIERQNLGSTPP